MNAKKLAIHALNRSLIQLGLRVNQGLAVRLATSIGRRYKLDPRLNKRQLRENLRMYFPDRDPDWIDATAKQLQINAYRARTLDKHFAPLLSTEALDRMIEPVNLNLVTDYLDAGRGVVVCGIHFGRFWPMPVWFSRKGYESSAYQRGEGQLPHLDSTFTAGSLNAQNPASSLRAVRLLKDGAIVFILLDTGDLKSPTTVDFLGMPTYVSSTPVRLSRIADAGLVTFLTEIDPDDPDRILMRFVDHIDPREVPEDEPPDVTLRRLLGPLEHFITEHPEQWYGFIKAHRRIAVDETDMILL